MRVPCRAASRPEPNMVYLKPRGCRRVDDFVEPDGSGKPRLRPFAAAALFASEYLHDAAHFISRSQKARECCGIPLKPGDLQFLPDREDCLIDKLEPDDHQPQ